MVESQASVVVFGIPTNHKEFGRSRQFGPDSFARRYVGGWARYEAEFMADYRRVIPSFESLGVRVVTDAGRLKVAPLFRQHRVIVLFSHWTDDAIELADGFVPIADVVDLVPSDFNGMLDLCVCHPLTLIDALALDRSACRTRYQATPAVPFIWLYYYRAAFTWMRVTGRPYAEVSEDLIAETQRLTEHLLRPNGKHKRHLGRFPC